MNKNVKYWADFAIVVGWFFLLSWLLGDVPHEWHAAVTFAVFYMSRLCAATSSATKLAREILEN